MICILVQASTIILSLFWQLYIYVLYRSSAHFRSGEICLHSTIKMNDTDLFVIKKSKNTVLIFKSHSRGKSLLSLLFTLLVFSVDI